MKKLALTLLAISFLSGCAITTEDSVGMSAFHGHHHEAVREFESEIGTYSQWNSEGSSVFASHAGVWGMAHLCNSYLEVSGFAAAKACFKYVEQEKIPYLEKKHGEEFLWMRTVTQAFLTKYHLELGDYSLAYASYEKALANDFKKSQNKCITHLSVPQKSRLLAAGAIAAVQLGKKEEAKQAIKAIDCQTQPKNLDSGLSQKIRNASKAKIYIALGDYQKAKESMIYSPDLLDYWGRIQMAFWTAGLTELADSGEEFSHPYVLNETFMLGKIALGLKDYEKAETIFHSILTDDGEHFWDRKRIDQRPGLYYQLLFDLGLIAERNKELNKAISYYKQSIDVIESQRQTINTEASKIGYIGNKAEVYEKLVSVLILQDEFEEAFVYAERSKARALVDMLASKKELVNTPSLKESHLIKKLDTLDYELLSQDLSKVDSDQTRSANRSLLRKTRKTLQESQPELASLVTVSTSNLADIQNVLRENETLVEFYGQDQDLKAFVVSKDHLQAVSLAPPDLQQRVLTFRKALTKLNDDEFIKESQALYNDLIAPIEHRIETEKLIIVPHGSLHYLPFNALSDGRNYVIDQYEITTLPSATVLTFLDKERSPSKEFLIIGNPDLNDTRLDLPGAEKEARAIADLVSGSTLLLNEKATETTVKQLAQHYKYIHLASHGVFDPLKPLTSNLLLTKDKRNDGKLTVSELYQLNLNADLVTLSACETGLGQIAGGDDVVGLTRGLLYAGTNNIIASLWKVDDEATNLLMSDFYRQLNYREKPSALRNAQLELKNSYYSHPYYWAAFQLTGR